MGRKNWLVDWRGVCLFLHRTETYEFIIKGSQRQTPRRIHINRTKETKTKKNTGILHPFFLRHENCTGNRERDREREAHGKMRRIKKRGSDNVEESALLSLFFFVLLLP